MTIRNKTTKGKKGAGLYIGIGVAVVAVVGGFIAYKKGWLSSIASTLTNLFKKKAE